MVNEKNKLIKELIIDVIFTLGLIGLGQYMFFQKLIMQRWKQ